MSAGVWSILKQLDGRYCVGGVALETVAQRYATPLYVYDADYISAQYQRYHSQGASCEVAVRYAVKANSNLSILRLLAAQGAGFDVVSVGEIERVLVAGGEAQSIVFSGVGKTDAEIERALAVGIGCFNVESAAELAQIAKIAQAKQCVAPIALRVNPNVDAKTHPYISTGLKDNKFGIALHEAFALYEEAAQDPHLQVCGVGCHIGSQITTLEPFAEAFDCILALADRLTAAGINIAHVDVGGGLGIAVPEQTTVPNIEALMALLYARLADKPYTLQVQPGRSIVGNAGVLLTTVIGTKHHSGREFVMVDAGMNDYIRPALYQAYPAVKNLSRASEDEAVCDVVGPVCESADIFVKDCPVQAKAGDLLAFSGVGAYGMAMASQYNSRLRPAEVLISQGNAQLIRRRDRLLELWQQEIDL